MKKIFINLCVVSFGLLIAFLLAECYARIASYMNIYPFSENFLSWVEQPGYHNIYDETLGWKGKAGYSGNIQAYYKPMPFCRRLVYEYNGTFNSRGHRDKEHEFKKNKKFRILILGDSFMWGVGVENHQRCTSILEDLLNDYGIDSEVINLAHPGYGTDQEYLSYLNEGIQYSPDLVVLFFSSGNFQNNLFPSMYLCPKPYFELDSQNNLILKNVPVPKGNLYSDLGKITKEYQKKRIIVENIDKVAIDIINQRSTCSASYRRSKFLFQWSKIYQALKLHLDRNPCANKLLLKFSQRSFYDLEDIAYPSHNVTKAIIKALADKVNVEGSRFIFVAIPDLSRIYLPEFYNGFGHGDFIPWCRKSGITVIDLMPVFQLEWIKNKTETCIKHDGHWNSNGHRLAAQAVFNYLIDNKLIIRK